MSDEIALEFTPEGDRRKRLRYQPLDDGRWSRVTEELRESQWRVVGQKYVDGLEFSSPAAAYSDRDAVTTFRGP